jgi:GntR family transcriptional regulator
MIRTGYPLYLQLKSWLLTQIESGVWSEGAMIPTEQELIALHGVSRTTVRQAVQDLVASGHLVRRQGRGTFVAHRSRLYSSSPLYGFVEEFEHLGRRVSVLRADIALVSCPAVVAGTLGLAPNTAVVRFFRLIGEAETPIFYDESFVPAALFPTLPDPDRDGIKIYALLALRGVTIGSGEQAISATVADAQTGAILKVKRGDALLHVERVTRDTAGVPVEFSSAYYCADAYQYRVRLVRRNSTDIQVPEEEGERAKSPDRS